MRETAAFSCTNILDSVSGELAVIDRQGIILQVNDAWCKNRLQNSGDAQSQMGIGSNYFEVCRFQGLRGDVLQTALDGIQQVLHYETPLFECEYARQMSDKRHWFLMQVTPLQGDPEVEAPGAVILHVDITERKLAERELTRLAYVDPLTGLPNRRVLFRRLQHELEEPTGQVFSLLFIDVDHFKSINDQHGHDVGDTVLVSIADLLRTCTRTDDVVARIGGDEFAVLCPRLNGVDGSLIANRILKAAETWTLPIRPDSLRISFSIGVATFPVHGNTANQLIRGADQAMYVCKRTGGCNYKVWSEQMLS